MAKSSSFYAGRISKVSATLVALQAELVQAQARETLETGSTYKISIGKGETAAIVDAVLVGQRVNDKGVTELRFQSGEGFDARFHDIKANRVVLPEAEVAEGEEAKPLRSSAKLVSVIEKVKADLVVLESDLEAAEAREQLVDGQHYTIRIGRGENKRDVLAVLLGQATVTSEKKDAEGNVVLTKTSKQLKFFYGQGFDAEIVVVSPAAVVVEDTAEAEGEGYQEPVGVDGSDED